MRDESNRGARPRDGWFDRGEEVTVRVSLDVHEAQLAQLRGEEVEQYELTGRTLGTLVEASSARVSMATYLRKRSRTDMGRKAVSQGAGNPRGGR